MRRLLRMYEGALGLGAVICIAQAAAAAVTVEEFSPQGTVKEVRQATARFSAPMVPFGDLRDVEPPFVVECPEPGTARWVDARTWAYDFDRDLPAGLRCSFTLRDGLKSLDGSPPSGPTRFEFSTGGPAIASSVPSDDDEDIDEHQAFVLELDGAATPESVLAHAGFEVEGIGERVGVTLLDGPARDELLAALSHWQKPEGPSVVLSARQTFPNGARVRLVWGAGIASPSGIATEEDQVLNFQVRPPFTLTVSCERENAKTNCIPLTPITVRFSAPVAWPLASRVALSAPDGTQRHPEKPDEPADFVSKLTFAPPFPESASFRILAPDDLRDDAGRALSAAGDDAALTVKTAPLPPLAKFASRFGIVESQADPALPVTIRNLDPIVQGRELTVVKEADDWRTRVSRLYEHLTGTATRIPPTRPEEVLPWLRRLGEARRTRSMFSGVTLPAGAAMRDFTLPQPAGPQAFQVVGIPFDSPGFYLVEIASPRLGASLLDKDQPMYVPAGALVTNMSVHLKWAGDQALVWVTTLADAKPVAGARVAAHSCSGLVLATGITDADGIARLSGLPDDNHAPRCEREVEESEYTDFFDDFSPDPALNDLDSGLFVTAATEGDLSFVHSSWNQGIESWRFQLPFPTFPAPAAAHTVLDRPLFRAGQTVHMKHVLRRETMAGFDLFPAADLPATAVITHLGSNQAYELPLTWQSNGTAEQEWSIPPAAKLGQYQVALQDVPGRSEFGSSMWTSASFRVEQFRVPLMKASIHLPGEPRIGTAPIPVDIAVDYLAGGPAAGLPAVLRAQLRPAAAPELADFERATFANGPVKEGIVRGGEEEEPPAAAEKRGILQRTALVLDAAGTARADIAGLPPVTTVSEVLAEVEYRDPNGEVQTTAATVPVWPAALVPGIEVENWAGTGKQIEATAVAIDTHRRPVAGAAVVVDAFQRQFYSTRKRLTGGFYAYEYVEDTRRLGQFCAGATDARGVIECSGPATADGEIILQATVSDPEGRSAAAHASAFVGGDMPWGFRVEASDRIDVIPERRQYEPGETARFQVRMPFERATALVTVEREGIGPARVLELSGKNPVVEVPLGNEDAPNAFVSVFLVRGRVGGVQPTALVDLGKPAFKLGIGEIRVGWGAHALKVDVSSDRAVYKVRDTATMRIAVRTAAGTPPPPGSEVAVAAVDEGLLELMPNKSWNLLDAMMRRRGYGVRTATAQTEVIGKRHFGRKALPQGGGGGRQTTRELFDTLLLWQGRVALDENGEATVPVKLNDSLTSFRIAAIATGNPGQFGTGATEIRSTQDLMLLSALPPLVRQGDSFPAQFTLRNTTDRTLEVTVAGTVEGLAAPLAPQTLALGPAEARVVAWPIAVPEGIDALRYTIEAGAPDGPSDRLAISQKVVPSVPVRTVQATLLGWHRGLGMPVERPADAIPGRGGVDVAGSASIAGNLAPLTRWLHDYPYSCLEQQVSVAIGLGDADAWQAIAAALPSYVDGDGLLKYFPSQTTGSDVLTSYVLSIAAAAELEMPAAVREKLTAGLRAFVEGNIRRTSPIDAPDLAVRKLAAVDALARAGAAEPELLDSIAVDPKLWPTSAVLDWWDILLRLPGVPERDLHTKDAERIVRARLNLQGTTMGFSTDTGDTLWWLMAGPDVNALRLIAQLVEFDLWRDDLPRLVRGALGRQRRGRWSTTVADAWGVVAMRGFSRAYEATPVTGTSTVALGGVKEEINWPAPVAGEPAPTVGPVHLPWPERPTPKRGAAKPAAAALTIDHTGSGAPWFTIASRAAIPLAAPLSSGYRIVKTVTPLAPRESGRLVTGDKLRVRLDIEAQSDMTWVVLDDPVPAGASHLGTDLARDSQIDAPDTDLAKLAPAFVERRFDTYRAYYDFVPKGRFIAEYVIRLNQGGSFGLPPTRVEALYAPEMFGEIPNQDVEVGP